MNMSGSIIKRVALLSLVLSMTVANSGCKLLLGLAGTEFAFASFWWTTPLIPVSPYYSKLIEDTYWEEERYEKAPILDPVEGEHAPIYCQDPPSPDQVIRSLPDDTSGGWTFLAETSRNDVRIVVEPIVDRIDECRFFPLVGPARLHHCHYKCTVYFKKVIRSNWPVPFYHADNVQDVVYIDNDHLIRCAGPDAPQ